MRFAPRLLLSSLICLAQALTAQAQESPNTTQSPYFFLKGGDPAVDTLPLKSTTAKVEIVGVIADVKVTQFYANTGKRPLEAVYIFPGSIRAAVYGMTMRIGDREIKAVIQEKGKARQVYENAKREGRSASLLEQQRPNVFQMNVANILPGDEIRVELHYTELLVPTDGEYQFVYPTVVGPRYGGVPSTPSATGEKWVASPYTKAGEAPFARFGMEVVLSAGMPIQTLSCSSHKTQTIHENCASTARVELDPSEAQGGNRDFILNYRLAGGQIQSGLLLSKGEKEGDENFFLLMVQPPKRPKPELIPPREYVFILDVSGSMQGEPLDTAKHLMNNLLKRLRPQDRFNVMAFEAGSSVWSPKGSKCATFWNRFSAKAFVSVWCGSGGTEMLSALQRALALPCSAGVSRTFVVVTDGYVSADFRVLEYLREHLGQANMFAFGIGSSVNRFLIEGMAHAGMGEAFIVDQSSRSSEVVKKFRDYIASPVLTNVKLSFQGFDVYDVEPLQVPDVLAERPILCFGKWRGEAKGNMTVNGVSGLGNYHQDFSVKAVEVQASDAALRNLWARHRIQLLGDYAHLGGSAKQAEITSLGLKYSLLTGYTSFVAVDTRVRKPVEPTILVNQPLPMPRGVPNSAVGSASNSASVSRLNGGTTFKSPKDRAAVVGIRVTLDSVEGDSALVPTADLRSAVEQVLGRLTAIKGLRFVGQGMLVVEFDASGSVSKIELNINSQVLREALEQVLKGWRIPGVEGKGPFKVRFQLQVRS